MRQEPSDAERSSFQLPAMPRAKDARQRRMPIAAVGVMLVNPEPQGDGAPARLLQRALLDCGLDQDAVHLTQPGRRLQADRKRLTPRLLVAMGAAAAEALLGRPVRLTLERGRITSLADGTRLLVTESPAAILRQTDAMTRAREYRRLVNNLLHAVPYRRRAA